MFKLFTKNRGNSFINFENYFVILDLIKVQVIIFGDICKKKNTVKLMRIVEKICMKKQ